MNQYTNREDVMNWRHVGWVVFFAVSFVSLILFVTAIVMGFSVGGIVSALIFWFAGTVVSLIFIVEGLNKEVKRFKNSNQDEDVLELTEVVEE